MPITGTPAKGDTGMPCIVVTRDGDTITFGADSARTARQLASLVKQPQAARRRHSKGPATRTSERDAFPKVTVRNQERRP